MPEHNGDRMVWFIAAIAVAGALYAISKTGFVNNFTALFSWFGGQIQSLPSVTGFIGFFHFFG